MRQQIETSLREIEATESVRILYACESGSRAWGFASKDSDYDVRFIYLHEPSWYLSVDLAHRRDVTERPIMGALDIGGWDLRKALQLLRKSNPPLAEWLGSPIIYAEPNGVASRLRDLLPEYYSPTAASYHYLHMARGNFREYLKGDIVWRKKYFYVLRPILAIEWLEAGLGIVPTEFDRLVRTLVPSGPLRDAIDSLVEIKSSGGELDRGPAIPALNEFLAAEFARMEGTGFHGEPKRPGWEALNGAFRAALADVYGET